MISCATRQPLAIIIENVPDILNFGGHNVPEEICVTLEAAGYRPAYTILNAAFFGVPQVRERLFIVATSTTLDTSPAFPDPTHFLELPRGYQASRRVALKHVDADSRYFREIRDPAGTLPLAVTVREALDDLPQITEHRTDPRSMRRRKFDQMIPYSRSARDVSEYARAMREWPGFETGAASDGHLVRITPRDFPIFERLPHGADYPQARKLAERMLMETACARGLDADEQNSRGMERAPPFHRTALRSGQVSEQMVEARSSQALQDADRSHRQGHLLPHSL